MKFEEWKKANGLNTDSEVRAYLAGKQMALYVCPVCDDILWDASINHLCAGQTFKPKTVGRWARG